MAAIVDQLAQLNTKLDRVIFLMEETCRLLRDKVAVR